MLPLLGYLSIPFLVPLNKLQNLIHVIHKGSIICNDWAQRGVAKFVIKTSLATLLFRYWRLFGEID